MRVAVLVNGLPGAGKTTLARAVSAELGLPLLSKDTVKETLADVLGPARSVPPEPPGPPAPPDVVGRLGAAASEVVWSLLAEAPRGAVVDSWLTPAREHVLAGLLRAGFGPVGDPVADPVLEVWCDLPPHPARERFEARAPYRHPVHGPQVDLPHWAEWVRQAEPLSLGPVLRVATDRHVDPAHVARWVDRVTCRG